jgi:DNA-binding LacI/PurR family transcriptional regulator
MVHSQNAKRFALFANRFSNTVMATISDVARACGVSPTTVSFVLNNGPRPVSARTRQRVLEAMERLNYQPSGVARGLARQRMHTIGVLFSGHEPRIVHNPYAVAVLDGIVAASTTRGYDVTLITRHWSQTGGAESPAFFDGRSDGILLLSPLAGADAALGSVSARHIPMVQVGAPAVLPQTFWMDVDNAQGARLAVQHLLSLGHRRIALLLGPSEYEHVTERRRTFLAELTAAGIAAPAEITIRPWAAGWKKAEQDIAALMADDNRPTALLATSDPVALLAQQVLKSLGVSIPQQVSLVGFDDSPGAGAELADLTTIRQPLFDIGQAAALRLISQIERDDASDCAETNQEKARLFAPELVVRGSTAPPLL